MEDCYRVPHEGAACQLALCSAQVAAQQPCACTGKKTGKSPEQDRPAAQAEGAAGMLSPNLKLCSNTRRVVALYSHARFGLGTALLGFLA
mmetsp:Transcript_46967/g.124035  ORF Transcript_46967/g.124035 Transcript_46967/m.124035 type:complete len:90 (-) Transcript_46967:90-359(-)